MSQEKNYTFHEYSQDALRTSGEGNLLQMTILVQELDVLVNHNALKLPVELHEILERMVAASQNDEHKVGIMYDGLALAGEAGELADYIKKCIGHGKSFDPEHAQKEIGDILWYVNRFSRRLGSTLVEVAQRNIAKLKARYPEGFSHQASENRPKED